MVDKSAHGKVGAPFAVDVERGKVHEFARAVKSGHPAHFTGPHPVSPPTFLTTMFFWEELVEESNPWHLVKMDRKRGMHAEQEYVFHGPPPRAGSWLMAQSRISEVYEKEGRRGGVLTFAVMVTEFRDATGALVAEGRLTGVETAKSAAEEGGSEKAAAKPAEPAAAQALAYATRDSSLSTVAMNVAWDALEEGQTGPAPLVIGPITRTDIVRYQGASGDFNPIHHDEPFALAASYPAPLVVGMFPAGVVNTWATSWLGPENVRRSRVRWREQVWPGDTLTCSGKIVKKYEEGGERKVDVEMLCTRQTGGVVLQGWATFVVP